MTRMEEEGPIQLRRPDGNRGVPPRGHSPVSGGNYLADFRGPMGNRRAPSRGASLHRAPNVATVSPADLSGQELLHAALRPAYRPVGMVMCDPFRLNHASPTPGLRTWIPPASGAKCRHMRPTSRSALTTLANLAI